MSAGSTTVSRAIALLFDDQYSPIVQGIVLFAVLALLPTLIDVSVFGLGLGAVLTINTLIVTLVFAFTGQAWNLVSGFTGYFSFGHAAFFGIGAYTTQKLLVDFTINPWAGMLVGGIVAMLAGFLIGYLNFRYDLRGHYFALATFAFAMLFLVTVRNMDELRGAIGFYRPFPEDYGLSYGLAAFQFRNPEPYYYVILAFLAIITVVAWTIKHSQVGLYLLAIRENENAAASVGIPTFHYKMFATGLSAFFTAWAGAFWSMYLEIIRPSTVFGLFRNVEILLPAVVGGLGTIGGAIVGAFIVFPLAEFFRATFNQIVGIDDIIYGIALVVIVLFLPDGVLSLRRRLFGSKKE